VAPEDIFKGHEQEEEGTDMKQRMMMGLMLTGIVLICTGCTMVSNMQSSVQTMMGGTDKNLLAQVPEDKRAGIRQAEQTLQLSEEALLLSEMQRDLVGLQKKYAEYEYDLKANANKSAQIDLKIEQAQAIDNAGLGEKAKNIEQIASFKSDKIKNEAERPKLEAKLSTTKMQINELSAKIKTQETKMKTANEKPATEKPASDKVVQEKAAPAKKE
jgi:hypothetical protein